MTLATCHCWDINKNQFPSCPSHISSPRSPPVAGGCHVGQHRYGTFPSLPSALSIGWHYLRKCRAVTLTWVWATSLPFFPAYLLPCTVQEWLPWCTYTFVYRSLLSICQQSWEQGGERRLTIKAWQQLARGSMRKTSSYIWNVHAKSLRKYHLVCRHWTQNNIDVFTSTLTFKARWLTLDKINCFFFFFFLQLLRKGPLLICLGWLWLEKAWPAICSRVGGHCWVQSPHWPSWWDGRRREGRVTNCRKENLQVWSQRRTGCRDVATWQYPTRSSHRPASSWAYGWVFLLSPSLHSKAGPNGKYIHGIYKDLLSIYHDQAVS